MITQVHTPSGVFVPARLIFNAELPAATLVTWMRLRSLSSANGSTPAYTLPELAARLGVHPGRLNKHMTQLYEAGAINWHSAENGQLILSFPEERIINKETPAESIHQKLKSSRLPSAAEKHNLAAYFPKRILGYLSYEDDEEDAPSGEAGLIAVEVPSSEPVKNFAKLATCKPADYTFVAK